MADRLLWSGLLVLTWGACIVVAAIK